MSLSRLQAAVLVTLIALLAFPGDVDGKHSGCREEAWSYKYRPSAHCRHTVINFWSLTCHAHRPQDVPLGSTSTQSGQAAFGAAPHGQSRTCHYKSDAQEAPGAGASFSWATSVAGYIATPQRGKSG
ncbi:hypothetical protein M409DRAFT_55035 [Zasmidium cellare ATCC 36951]|uniref:Secreted protein n=1 Tax=Zasmidium cellare ATCC 36951 TaxID=1080233 RepID=A0A6A6CIY3_ZASCE|nr:uncharacterized protein M409DRAFT_55035 [Zasmidium cellare ATCC 36951]KAF2166160.1 hypothetical protein M409DRAFT_55035 [Zasmidium cellare ATCC 36951]